MLSAFIFRLEGQIVGATLACRLLSGREGRGSRSDTSHRGTSNGYLTTQHVVGTDIVEPTALIFVGVDIELDGDILVHLNIELLNPVFSENTEHATLRILTRDFNHIVLRHPRVTCAG